MNTIINGSTKFQSLLDDPRMRREGSMTTFLSKLKRDGHTSEQFYNSSRPSESYPDRLYGLPKIHNVDEKVSLRPILAFIRTFNYALANTLQSMLSSIVNNEAIIKDSFAFVEELRTLPNSTWKCQMVSFDIVSLSTNIPLSETIEIILNHMCNGATLPPKIGRGTWRNFSSMPRRIHISYLTPKSINKSMGFEGVTIDTSTDQDFPTRFWKTYSALFEELGILYWKCYVVDTFVLLDPDVDHKAIRTRLSGCHPALQFTSEQEVLTDLKQLTLAFLDVLLERQSGIGCETTIYRKKTYSSQMTKWNSFVPKG